MSRVQLRRAAIEVLKIDNKEASNSKSGDLIERILEEGGEGGGSKSSKASSKKSSRTTKATSRSSKSKSKAAPAETSSNGVGELVDAVGKAVDETKEDLGSKLEAVLDNQDHIMKQQFILFGMLSDVYKAVDEPDALEARLEELEEEWNSQGND
jgi:hypothetical protein